MPFNCFLKVFIYPWEGNALWEIMTGNWEVHATRFLRSVFICDWELCLKQRGGR